MFQVQFVQLGLVRELILDLPVEQLLSSLGFLLLFCLGLVFLGWLIRKGYPLTRNGILGIFFIFFLDLGWHPLTRDF